MNHQRIVDTLLSHFEASPVVFWHDEGGEFKAALDEPALSGITCVRLDGVPSLQVKMDIEADPKLPRLLYSTHAMPEPQDDWLLDVRLRSKNFHADASTMLLEDLGLTSLALLPHLKNRAKFLRAKDRVERLKRLVLPADDADTLDRKMMAVLLRSDEHDALALAMRLLHGLWVAGEPLVGPEPKAWGEIVAQELEASFWAQMQTQLGYAEAAPTLADLLLRVLVSDLARGLNGPCPAALDHFVLPNKTLAANASVLASRWRSDLNLHKSYADLSAAVSEQVDLRSLLANLEVEALADCVTFAAVERRLIAALKGRITSQGGAVLTGLRPLLAKRRDGPWVSRMLASASEETKALAACYDALEAAAEFLALKDAHSEGISFADLSDGVAQYRKRLFAFDQLYRRFHYAAAVVEPIGWAVLHGLRDLVEAAYSGWFMPHLASAWDKVAADTDGCIGSWKLGELPAQQNFFFDRVSSSKRVFVVISDALRYEAAEELSREINSKNRLVATLEAMQGVLPSYTALGMASLLPHQTLEYRARPDGAEVWADGQPTSTLDARSNILAKHGGLAIKADELLALGKEKGRECVRDKKVVYVYHDRIDMLGDKQVSEGQTFEAVADTITELQAIVSFIVNNLNGSTVLVTADHGFIYQDSALDGADKAALGDKPEGTLIAKKRYLLGKSLPAPTGGKKVWRGNTANTAGTLPGEGSLDFWLPKGTTRFHFAGGARFVHGSAMPQEVIVPVVLIRESESASAKTKQVELNLLGSSNKVVTNTQRFEFIQSEAVSARVLARSVVVSLRDGQELISDEQTLTFDSDSASMNDRVRSVFLTIRSGSYDRMRDYHLVARDVQSKVEVLRMAVRIDLSFTNDF